MKQPVIAFCTTCKGRLQHLQQTLPKNMADNTDYANLKFIVMNYNSQDGLIEYLRTEQGNAINSGRLVTYSHLDASTFNMAHAKNMAHRLGILEGADILVNLDADNFTEAGFATYIANSFEGKPNMFMFGNMVKGVLPRGINGRIAVRVPAFLEVGGYDERYGVWSPDDKDFDYRLRLLGVEREAIDPKYLNAIRHNDKIRFKEYPEAKKYMHDYPDTFPGHQHCPPPPIELHHKPRQPIANFGKFGKGVVYRNFQWDEPMILGNVPTRIFGIGMHKTATTSLYHAFEILGFDAAHWKNAHWAKRVWTEMKNEGRSPTLEKHYALCDFPITILFRELDRAYPSSKFILTTRNESGWLETVCKHWDPAFNQYRKTWDTDPFSHKIHNEVYGQKTFDPKVMLDRYRCHNAEVLEYFKDRPHDLLVLEMDNGGGWLQLCNFLGNLPIPKVPYPRAYAAY